LNKVVAFDNDIAVVVTAMVESDGIPAEIFKDIVFYQNVFDVRQTDIDIVNGIKQVIGKDKRLHFFAGSSLEINESLVIRIGFYPSRRGWRSIVNIVV